MLWQLRRRNAQVIRPLIGCPWHLAPTCRRRLVRIARSSIGLSACPSAFCWRLGIAERNPFAPYHVCALHGAQEGMEKDCEGSLEESLWHIIHARELIRFRGRPQRRDPSDARTTRHSMVDNWLFGSIRHEVPRLFSAYGQGLLQHDKDRSEREHNSIEPALLGVIRLDHLRYLPNYGSRQVLVKPAHAVIPGLGPGRRHHGVSLLSPPGKILLNAGRPEEYRRQLA
jgi:hypothetical protein